MRDIPIVITVIAFALLALWNPLYGIYGWMLVSLANIHRLGWGIAINMQPGLIIAAATMASVLIHRKRPLQIAGGAIPYLLFWLFATLTTFFAMNQNQAWDAWGTFSKTAIFFFLTIYIVRTMADLKKVIIFSVLCIAFYGAKGGIFSLLTGGSYRVYGPERSFIQDNNDLALALNMTLPFIYWLSQEAKTRIRAHAWTAILILCIISEIFSYSRGGQLTLVCVIILLFLNGKRKAALALVLGGSLLIASFYIGPTWINRMETMSSYEEEGSAASRLMAWRVAFEFAKDHPVLGGGFKAINRTVYAQYDERATIVSHSIYFGTMAEQGFVGLFIYLLIFIVTLISISRWKKRSQNESLCSLLAIMRISLLAFLVGGAFYERQYFDYCFLIVSYTVIGGLLVREEVKEREPENSIGLEPLMQSSDPG
jgi:putative inorganic carbon (HCO3(-)) transporter